MYNIVTLNSISPKGLQRLPASLFNIAEDDAQAPPDGILVRSAGMLEAALPGSPK